MTREAMKKVCEDVLEIMKTYHEQYEDGNIDTPGGLEHMGDVWRLLQEWETLLLADTAK